MNKRRLLALATFLETKVPRKKFNMQYWGTTPHNEFSCGTTACALGWAGNMPSFKRAGLKTVPSAWGGDVIFGSYRNFGAAMEFFDLDFGESQYLFDPMEYDENRRGPKTVAKRIRKLVKDGKIEQATT